MEEGLLVFCAFHTLAPAFHRAVVIWVGMGRTPSVMRVSSGRIGISRSFERSPRFGDGSSPSRPVTATTVH